MITLFLSFSLAQYLLWGNSMDAVDMEYTWRKGSDEAKSLLLAKLWKSKDKVEREKVADSYLIHFLGASNRDLRYWSIIFLGNRSWHPRVFDEFSKIARDENEALDIRREAIHFISLKETKCLTLFSDLLGDKNPQIRSATISGLRFVPVDKQNLGEHHRLYIKALADHDSNIRHYARGTLFEAAKRNAMILDTSLNRQSVLDASVNAVLLQLAPLNKNRFLRVIEMAKNEDALIKEVAAEGLENGRVFDDEILTQLNKLLLNDSASVRAAVCRSLVTCGPEASKYVPNLVKCLTDADVFVIHAAVMAAGSLRQESYISGVLAALKEKDRDLQLPFVALDALVAIGIDSKEVLEVIRDCGKSNRIYLESCQKAIDELESGRKK